jgi:lysozyme family protein
MDLFNAWWSFVMLPNNDGLASDGPGTVWGWTYSTWRSAQLYSDTTDTSMPTFLAMTQDQAAELADIYFWSRMLAPNMAPGVNISVLDWAWTSGGAVAEIQAGIGVVADGVIGPGTLAALNAAAPATLIANIYAWRVAYYNDLGYQTTYPGLYRRAQNCQTLAQIYGSII